MPQPSTPPGTLCLSSGGSRGDRQLSQALGVHIPGSAGAPSSRQWRRTNFSRPDAFPGSAPHCPAAVPIPGAARSFPRTVVQVPSTPQGHAEHPTLLQDTRALPPQSKRHGVARAASSWQLCPAQPFPAGSHPLQRVRLGQAQLFWRANPLRRDLLCSVWPTSPARAEHSRELLGRQRSPARGWRERWPRAGEPGLPEELGLSEAWEAREHWTLDRGAGSGPAGAWPAQTGSCYQLMAAWQRAQSEDRRHFRWLRRGG